MLFDYEIDETQMVQGILTSTGDAIRHIDDMLGRDSFTERQRSRLTSERAKLEMIYQKYNGTPYGVPEDDTGGAQDSDYTGTHGQSLDHQHA